MSQKSINKLLAFSFSVIIASSAWGNSAANESFKQFAELASLNNKDITQLYADDARIEHIVMDGWSLVEARMISGSDYRAHLQTPNSKLFNGHSEFQEVDFFTNGSRIGFFGIRYSRHDCFGDEQYFVIFDKLESGDYKIVRERIEKPVRSQCGQDAQNVAAKKEVQSAPKGVANFNFAAAAYEEENPYVASVTLEKIAQKLEANPPNQLDKNTEFVSFKHEDRKITFTHKLSNYQSNPKYDGLLKHVTKASMVRMTCENARLVQALDYQGEIHYDYQDKANKDIFDIEVKKQDCNQLAQSLKANNSL